MTDWIAKLEAALKAGEKLAPMDPSSREAIVNQMRDAGRFDLVSAARRLIPLPLGTGRRRSAREALAEHRAAERSLRRP